MICNHLKPIEELIRDANVKEIWRGRPWSENCREWVYYDCYIDTNSLAKRIELADCVVTHEHLGTHDGQEYGFICKEHHDGVMGVHELSSTGKTVIK